MMAQNNSTTPPAQAKSLTIRADKPTRKDRRYLNKGRPQKTFRSDPDRVVLAFAAALRELGATRNGALEIAVAVMHGRPVGPRANQRRGHGLAMLNVNYELIRRRGAPTTIAVGAKKLRRKIERILKDKDDDAIGWLTIASLAFAIALGHTVLSPRDRARAIDELTKSLGSEKRLRLLLHRVLGVTSRD